MHLFITPSRMYQNREGKYVIQRGLFSAVLASPKGAAFHLNQHAGLQKVECPYFNIAIRTNPPAVQIEDVRQIPAQFMRQPEPPPPAPDKKAIKEALEAGTDVPGARLVRNQSLRIQ